MFIVKEKKKKTYQFKHEDGKRIQMETETAVYKEVLSLSLSPPIPFWWLRNTQLFPKATEEGRIIPAWRVGIVGA